jgi:hypothetical protein
MLSEATLAYGARAMTALLGVDALYRTESGDGDGLAVLNMDGDGAYLPDAFTGYDEARACFKELEADALDLPEEDRRLYYQQLCRSTRAFIDWREGGLGFEAQLSRFLHVPAEPASGGTLDSLRGVMRTLLTDMGYPGDLAEQAAAWEERNRVPPEDVADALRAFLDEAWDRTGEHLVEIPAPRSDGMKVSTVSGVAFNARCDYSRRTIELNIDPVLTRSGLKHLAVHEGYPGHYLQFKLRETMARAGTAAPDVLLSIVNSASSSVFEGIADYGMKLIDWEDCPDDQVQGLMNLYRAGIATGAAWRLHALGWDEGRVADWLREQSLVGGAGWVANRMAFIAAPARAVLIWSYWWGEASVAPAWRGVGRAERKAYVDYIYGRMHSPQTVGMLNGVRLLPWEEGDDLEWSRRTG